MKLKLGETREWFFTGDQSDGVFVRELVIAKGGYYKVLSPLGSRPDLSLFDPLIVAVAPRSSWRALTALTGPAWALAAEGAPLSSARSCSRPLKCCACLWGRSNTRERESEGRKSELRQLIHK